MIKKKIHYIWLGGKPKSRLTQICINSWYRVLNDYEIVEWNENNLNIEELKSQNRFLRKCFDCKLWAFVSDYLRLYILYKEGGIYLDTDVETVNNFDNYLQNKMFLGYEAGGYIGTGIIGAEKGNNTIRRILDFYDNEIWECNYYNNPIIFKQLYQNNPSIFDGCIIYDEKIFSPYTPDRDIELNHKVDFPETITIHWYSGNWNMSLRGYIFLNTKYINNPIIKFIVSVKKFVRYYIK